MTSYKVRPVEEDGVVGDERKLPVHAETDAGAADDPMLRPRRAATRFRSCSTRLFFLAHWSTWLAVLLGSAAVHVGVGLVVLGGSARPAGRLLGRLNRLTSPISATNTAPRTGAMPGSVYIARGIPDRARSRRWACSRTCRSRC